jgi:hypothetical protein
MNERRYSYAQLGMLLGLLCSGGLAVSLFATTGNAVYFALVGVGLVLGLSLGAAFDRAKRSEQDQSTQTKEGT